MENRANATAVGVNYRSTRQLVGTLEASPGHPGRIQLDLMNEAPLYVRGREAPVYLPLRIPAMPQLPATVRSSLDRYNQLHILWTALHLRDSGRRILISVAQEPEQTMRWFVEGMARPGWDRLARFDEPDEANDQRLYRESIAACMDYCGADSYELALLQRGIATNHGQMPQRLRRLMTHLIERRICGLTVATATLTEGVNLPFDIIFLTALSRRSFDPVEKTQIVEPIPPSEFRNLAGRAGRPGAAEAVEGMTLIGLPQAPVSTAPGQIPRQRRQARSMAEDYASLLNRLAAEAGPGAEVASPLATLLKLIAKHLRTLFAIEPGDEMLAWLAATLPETVTPNVGTSARGPQAQLADSLDELDGILLAAIEELAQFMAAAPDGQAAETYLRRLWTRTFAHVAAVQEAWLEAAFVHRGRHIVESLYRNAEQRRRLYQFGYAPAIGRRFETIAPQIRAELASAADYGMRAPADRLMLFVRLGELIREQPGFGFRTRATGRRSTNPRQLDRSVTLVDAGAGRCRSFSPRPTSMAKVCRRQPGLSAGRCNWSCCC